MATTLKASRQGLQLVDQARRKKGWAKSEEAWFQMATTTEATLKRFWRKLPIRQETFVELCRVVGIEDLLLNKITWKYCKDCLSPLYLN